MKMTSTAIVLFAIFSLIDLGNARAQEPTAGVPPSTTIKLPDEKHEIGPLQTIRGRTLLSDDTLISLGSADLPKLGQERRWATDLLNNTERALIEASIKRRDKPPPAQMQLISDSDYHLQVDKIDSRVQRDEMAQRDAAQSETQKATAALDLLDQIRQRSRLDLQLLETRDFNQQNEEFLNAERDVATREVDLATLQHYVSVIDDVIAKNISTIDADRVFRQLMGIAFTVLVGLLICGFYIAAHNDPDMRKNFLSEDRGLQFIALFSLIIAIVLFGVMRILEGKELSALLGGLSGYILGRSNIGQTPAKNSKEAT